MNAGRLTKKITIQSKTTAKSTVGEAVESWADVADRMSQIIPVNGREMLSAGQEQAERTVRIVLRYDSITGAVEPNTHRIVYGQTVYNVQHVNNVLMANRVLELTCREDV